MDESIMTIGMFERRVIERAQRDHAAGVPLSQCEYNHGSNAKDTRAEEYARLDALAKAAPVAHAAPAARHRVELAQAGQS